MAGLQYIGGYVLKNFIQACSINIYFFIYGSKSPESQQPISIHKAGRGESDDASQKLVS